MRTLAFPPVGDPSWRYRTLNYCYVLRLQRDRALRLLVESLAALLPPSDLCAWMAVLADLPPTHRPYVARWLTQAERARGLARELEPLVSHLASATRASQCSEYLHAFDDLLAKGAAIEWIASWLPPALAAGSTDRPADPANLPLYPAERLLWIVGPDRGQMLWDILQWPERYAGLAELVAHPAFDSPDAGERHRLFTFAKTLQKHRKAGTVLPMLDWYAALTPAERDRFRSLEAVEECDWCFARMPWPLLREALTRGIAATGDDERRRHGQWVEWAARMPASQAERIAKTPYSIVRRFSHSRNNNREWLVSDGAGYLASYPTETNAALFERWFDVCPRQFEEACFWLGAVGRERARAALRAAAALPAMRDFALTTARNRWWRWTSCCCDIASTRSGSASSARGTCTSPARRCWRRKRSRAWPRGSPPSCRPCKPGS